jgi:hypothetical protein
MNCRLVCQNYESPGLDMTGEQDSCHHPSAREGGLDMSVDAAPTSAGPVYIVGSQRDGLKTFPSFDRSIGDAAYQDPDRVCIPTLMARARNQDAG